MNKIKRLAVLLAAIPLLTTSCLKDQEDIFDGSASDRMGSTLEQTRDILRSSEQGWVIDYYVGTNQISGGYAYVVKFDSLTCTASSELISEPEKSYYKLTSDNGPVLTFDTYNKVLHDLATPSSGNYEGAHADFEFLVLSATPELIILKGKKTQSIMQMHPLNMPAEEYLAKVAEMEENMIIGSAQGKFDTLTIEAQLDLDNRQISFTAPYDTAFHTNMAYTYTDKGIRLYKNIERNNVAYGNFDYDAMSNKLISLSNNGSMLAMDCSLPATWRHYDAFEGSYTIEYDENSSIRVTLEKSGDGESYLLKGLNSNYNVVCSYSKSKGGLAIGPQNLAEIGNTTVKLCMLEKSGGTLMWADEVGLVIRAANGETSSEFIVESNGYEDFTSAGLILWVFNNGSALNGSNVNSWFSQNQKWLFSNGDYMIWPMKKFIKNN